MAGVPGGLTPRNVIVRVRRRTLRDFHDKFCGCFTVSVIEKMYNLYMIMIGLNKRKEFCSMYIRRNMLAAGVSLLATGVFAALDEIELKDWT
ncbi:MAG: hypothetical protein IKC14_05940, partial [Kiritimatiellae bacterium]|nr:hypothetical protein [Kiritimatiellia bacterium]